MIASANAQPSLRERGFNDAVCALTPRYTQLTPPLKERLVTADQRRIDWMMTRIVRGAERAVSTRRPRN